MSVSRSTSACNSSHTSTSGNGSRTASSRPATTWNFPLDLPFVLWYLFALAALLLAMRDFHPNSNRVRGESRYSLFQVSTKGGTSSPLTPLAPSLVPAPFLSAGAPAKGRTSAKHSAQGFPPLGFHLGPTRRPYTFSVAWTIMAV